MATIEHNGKSFDVDEDGHLRTILGFSRSCRMPAARAGKRRGARRRGANAIGG